MHGAADPPGSEEVHTVTPQSSGGKRGRGVLDEVSQGRAVATGQAGRGPVLGGTRPGGSGSPCRDDLPQGQRQGGTGPRPQPVFTALLFGSLGSACTEVLARWGYRLAPFCFLL